MDITDVNTCMWIWGRNHGFHMQLGVKVDYVDRRCIPIKKGSRWIEPTKVSKFVVEIWTF